MFFFFITLFCFIFKAHGSAIPTIDIRDSRIIGGKDALDGEVPYQVSLRSENLHSCGGSILSNKWVLTAAHCTTGLSGPSFSVVVGTNDLVEGGDRYSVDTVIIHPNYDTTDTMNDISLVKVSGEIQFNEKVQPIQLPESDTAGGASLILSGWGQTSYPRDSQNRLQIITLTALSVEACQDIYTNRDHRHICTFTRVGEGACFGDSGGPLVENNSVVGISSLVVPCAVGFPDIYTRVFAFKEWILEQISSNEMTTEKLLA